jgi:hypothetical protein
MHRSTDLSHLSGEEIEGGYRRLCGALLVTAATALCQRPRRVWPSDTYRQELARQEEVARRWSKGGVGVLTFEEACEAIDWEPAAMREEMGRHCIPGARTRKTVSRRGRGPQTY